MRLSRRRIVPLGILLAAALAAAPAMAAEEDSAGNNLSFPVIFSDGAALPLQGEFGSPVFDGASVVVDGTPWYVQKDPQNLWQAGSLDAVAAGIPGLDVSTVDWGDNLEARAWPAGATVRVETVLYKDLATDPETAPYSPLTGFTMQQLSGQGVDEVWGTNTVTYDSTEATVYSGTARLVIQPLAVSRDDPALAGATWDPTSASWMGAGLVGAPVVDSPIWAAGDGPGNFGSEVNVAGKAIYGFVWKTGDLPPGDYRVTFSLDGVNAPVALNTSLANATILVSEEEIEEEADDGGDTAAPDLGGGTGVVDAANNLTYIDVRLTPKPGGGGGEGGQGQGGPPADPGQGGQGQGGPPAAAETGADKVLGPWEVKPASVPDGYRLVKTGPKNPVGRGGWIAVPSDYRSGAVASTSGKRVLGPWKVRPAKTPSGYRTVKTGPKNVIGHGWYIAVRT